MPEFKEGVKRAGRPKGSLNKRNPIFQDAFSRVLTQKVVNELIEKAVEHAKRGKPGLLLGLLPYGLQEMPKAVEMSGPEGGKIKITLKLSES